MCKWRYWNYCFCCFRALHDAVSPNSRMWSPPSRFSGDCWHMCCCQCHCCCHHQCYRQCRRAYRCDCCRCYGLGRRRDRCRAAVTHLGSCLVADRCGSAAGSHRCCRAGHVAGYCSCQSYCRQGDHRFRREYDCGSSSLQRSTFDRWDRCPGNTGAARGWIRKGENCLVKFKNIDKVW